MKSLCLLRHAKSGEHDKGVRDLDRSLNERGRRAARLIGKWMADEQLEFDHAVVSPAERTKETLAEIESGYGKSLGAIEERGIYLASSVTLLEIVRAFADDYDNALLLGHNPGLEDLVLDLVPDDGANPLRDTVYVKFPTCSLALLEFDVAQWSDISEGTARITRFIRPRDLDPDLGPEE